MAHGLETVLDAAEKLKAAGRNDVGFLLVGDGARRESLEGEAAERGLTDMVKFTGRLPKTEMPRVLASSETLLVHLRACDLFTTVIPSKIFEAMAMERPIIMGVQGESADIVREAEAGLDMEPGNADSLIECVDRLAKDDGLYSSLSSSARRFVLDEFSRDAFAATYLELLASLVPGVDSAPQEDLTAPPAAN